MLASMSHTHYKTFTGLGEAPSGGSASDQRCIALAGPRGHVLLPALNSSSQASEESDIKRILDRTAFSSRVDAYMPRPEVLPAFSEITAGINYITPRVPLCGPAAAAAATTATTTSGSYHPPPPPPPPALSARAPSTLDARIAESMAQNMSRDGSRDRSPARRRSLSPSPSPASRSPSRSATGSHKRRARETALPIEHRRRYICKTCAKGFTTSGHLARHNRIHTGEKNHLCPFEGCGQRFSRHDNCVQHYKTHVRRGA